MPPERSDEQRAAVQLIELRMDTVAEAVAAELKLDKAEVLAAYQSPPYPGNVAELRRKLQRLRGTA